MQQDELTSWPWNLMLAMKSRLSWLGLLFIVGPIGIHVGLTDGLRRPYILSRKNINKEGSYVR